MLILLGVLTTWLLPCALAQNYTGDPESKTFDWINSKLVFDGTGYDEFVYIGMENEMKNFRSSWSSYYHDLNIVTWIKSELGGIQDRQYIIEGYFDQNFQLFIQNSTLGYTLHGSGADSTTYTCPETTYTDSKAKWMMIIISINERDRQLDIFMKPLDTTSEPKQVSCSRVTAQTSVHGNNTVINSNTVDDFGRIILGRGFKGEIAYTAIGTARNYNNNWRECLKDTDHFACQTYWSGHFDYEGEILPNTSVRREIETEIKLVFNTRYSCNDEKITVAIKPSGLNLISPTTSSRREYDYYRGNYNYIYVTEYNSNITLGPLKKECNFTWNNDNKTFEFSGGLSDCGFKSKEVGDLVVYSNTIFYHTRGDSRKLMGLSCRYAPRPIVKEEIVLEAFAIEDPNRVGLVTDHTFTSWDMKLVLYGDSEFSEPLNNPVKLIDPSNNVHIYVEATVTADISGVEIVIESCKTRVTLSTEDTLESILITDTQPVKNSVRMIKTTQLNKKRFRFKAANFEEYPDALVYLSCVLSAA